MTDSVLLVEKKDQIATLTLNRPESMNALSTQLRDALEAAFEDLANDTGIRVAILTGAGRAFCAGLNLKELAQGQGLIEELGHKREARANLTTPFKAFGRPVIGAINGPAITGGFELERKMNSVHFQTLQAETIAERRKDVMARGRNQKGSD